MLFQYGLRKKVVATEEATATAEGATAEVVAVASLTTSSAEPVAPTGAAAELAAEVGGGPATSSAGDGGGGGGACNVVGGGSSGGPGGARNVVGVGGSSGGATTSRVPSSNHAWAAELARPALVGESGAAQPAPGSSVGSVAEPALISSSLAPGAMSSDSGGARETVFALAVVSS